ncbi:MAG: transcription termination/antitermination protein NusG, partial [Nitrospinota bacterium]
SPWYALRTRSRHEKFTTTHLKHAGFRVFLPLVTRVRQWKDRRVHVDFPLFPGYCFVRCEETEFRQLRSTPGAVGLVGTAGTPVPVPDEQVEAVWKLVSSTLPYDPVPTLEPGMRVRVTRGPLADVEGILIRKEPRARLVIAIDLLHQGAALDIDAHDIEPA